MRCIKYIYIYINIIKLEVINKQKKCFFSNIVWFAFIKNVKFQLKLQQKKNVFMSYLNVITL